MADHGIANMNYLFGDDRVIRSEGPRNLVWFYRENREYKVSQDGDVHTVPKETIRRNINHDDTEVTTKPVEQSPFA